MTRVAIIGAGRGGAALLQLFTHDPLVRIVGMADLSRRAPGMRPARRMGIPTTTDYRSLLRGRRADLLIDVTGDPALAEELGHLRRPAVLGGTAARFMWQLIEERLRQREALVRKESRLAVVEERTRIAWDLHDGLVQMLVGLGYSLDLCETLAVDRPQDCLAKLKKTKAIVRQAIREARGIVFNLRTLSFAGIDLIPAIRTFLMNFHRQYGIETGWVCRGQERRLSPRAKLFLFRIIQEALSNVQRHAKASRVDLRLTVGRAWAEAVMADDGVGFNLAAVRRDPARQESYGLQTIDERARLLGGSSVITTRPGAGTRVRVRLPLAEGGHGGTSGSHSRDDR